MDGPRPRTPGRCLGCGMTARWHCSHELCLYVVCENANCRLVRHAETGRGFIRKLGLSAYGSDKPVTAKDMPWEPKELLHLDVEDEEDEPENV